VRKGFEEMVTGIVNPLYPYDDNSSSTNENERSATSSSGPATIDITSMAANTSTASNRMAAPFGMTTTSRPRNNPSPLLTNARVRMMNQSGSGSNCLNRDSSHYYPHHQDNLHNHHQPNHAGPAHSHDPGYKLSRLATQMRYQFLFYAINVILEIDIVFMLIALYKCRQVSHDLLVASIIFTSLTCGIGLVGTYLNKPIMILSHFISLIFILIFGMILLGTSTTTTITADPHSSSMRWINFEAFIFTTSIFICLIYSFLILCYQHI